MAVELASPEVNADGLAAIAEHLERFRDYFDETIMYPPNQAMFDRLLSGQRTLIDLRFYQHELTELTLVRDLELDQADAHSRTLAAQGILVEPGVHAELYHWDVIGQFHDYFNNDDRRRAEQIRGAGNGD